MAIQKKSLITNLSATKKAVVASRSATPASATSSVLSPVHVLQGSSALKAVASFKSLKGAQHFKAVKSTKHMRGTR